MNTYIFKVIGLRVRDRKKAFVQASTQAEAVKRFIAEFPGHTDEIACEFLFDVQDLIKVE